MKGLSVQDRGVGVILDPEWGDWYDYIPGYSTDPMFGLNNNKDFPYDNVYFCVEVGVLRDEGWSGRQPFHDLPVENRSSGMARLRRGQAA